VTQLFGKACSYFRERDGKAGQTASKPAW